MAQFWRSLEAKRTGQSGHIVHGPPREAVGPLEQGECGPYSLLLIHSAKFLHLN